jgi:uncharacterized protein YdeI (YjbR/CyaY-like superfamily)
MARAKNSDSGRVKPKFFATPDAFRKWLDKHHASSKEQWVGFYKKASGKPSITWPESVDQALCYGWIDGIRKSVDAESYMIRFTPRRPNSIWSAVNIRRAKELTKLGVMKPAGTRMFEARDEAKANRYSFERDNVVLDKALEKQFRANRKAWDFFQKQPPGYRKIGAWYVMSAKRAETRQKRLQTLIADSANAKRIGLVADNRKNEAERPLQHRV